MCSLTMTSSSLRSASSLCRSEERSGKRVPVETHFIVVVDVSGSMSAAGLEEQHLSAWKIGVKQVLGIYNRV